MKITLKIAKLQLLNLLYSPISWVVLMVFALYSGIKFTDAVDMINNIARGGLQHPATQGVFMGHWGYFSKVQELLFLFIPILSMGLISNEMNSGTIKLLYSSPLKIRSIVIGKYLAMFMYSIIVVLLMFLVTIGADMFIHNMDWGYVISGLLAFFLLISSYAAIGLFMSSLTRYQVISGMATIALLFVLDYVSKFGQDIAILSEILNWVSISVHTKNMMAGNIISYDVLYFIILTVLFLAFTVNKMKADRLGKKGKINIRLLSLSYLVVTGVFISLITMPKLTFYKDMTATKKHTPHKESIEIYKQLSEAPLNIKSFQNLVTGKRLLPDRIRTYNRSFNKYRRYINDLKLDCQWFYAKGRWDMFSRGGHKDLSPKEKAWLKARFYKVDTTEILAFENLEKLDYEQMKDYDLTHVLINRYEYNGKYSYLNEVRDDNRMYIFEEDYTTALKKLLVPEANVVFLTGHKERRIDRSWESDYSRWANERKYRYSLVNNGFKVSVVNLEEGEIPENTDILIIADPQLAYSEVDLAKLKSYINKGGNLLLAGEAQWSEVSKPLFDLLGLAINTEDVLENATGSIHPESPEAFKFKDDIQVNLIGVSHLKVSGESTFKVQKVLSANNNTALMLALTREVKGKQQKIFVSADADFLSDKESLKNRDQTRIMPSESLCQSMLYWFTDGDYPVRFTIKEAKDMTVSLSNAKVSLYKIIYIWIIPFAILLIGGFIFWRRRM